MPGALKMPEFPGLQDASTRAADFISLGWKLPWEHLCIKTCRFSLNFPVSWSENRHFQATFCSQWIQFTSAPKTTAFFKPLTERQIWSCSGKQFLKGLLFKFTSSRLEEQLSPRSKNPVVEVQSWLSPAGHNRSVTTRIEGRPIKSLNGTKWKPREEQSYIKVSILHAYCTQIH